MRNVKCKYSIIPKKKFDMTKVNNFYFARTLRSCEVSWCEKKCLSRNTTRNYNSGSWYWVERKAHRAPRACPRCPQAWPLVSHHNQECHPSISHPSPLPHNWGQLNLAPPQVLHLIKWAHPYLDHTLRVRWLSWNKPHQVLGARTADSFLVWKSFMHYFNGLVQDCGNSSAFAMELTHWGWMTYMRQ